MLNFGYYSAKKFPNVKLFPTLVDRILEVIAVLITLCTWGVAIGFDITFPDSEVGTAPFYIAGVATLCFILFGWCGYIPVRRVKFPFRITEFNVYTQFFLAVRTVRVLNVVLALLFLVRCLGEFGQEGGFSRELCDVLTSAAVMVLLLVLIIYYIFAYRYR